MASEVQSEKRQLNPEKLMFCIHTFGCQMNENDSERIGGILSSVGAKKSHSLEESNLIIINTCAVRKKSEEKLFSLLGRLAQLKKRKNVVIGVVGCVAQLYQSKILERNLSVDFVLGPCNYKDIAQVVLKHYGEKLLSTSWSRKWEEAPFEHMFRESDASAYVTIMEGCDNFCSYCIVPFTRGRERCRPFKYIIQEINELASKGYKEIQLLGQNVNSYRDPSSGIDFSRLIKEVNKVEGLEWFRFITSHPKNFTPDIALAIKKADKFCHQLHLPLQSGSSSVLKSMNRNYTAEEYLDKIALLRNILPDISLSTDIIVGFPGETEKEFQETLRALKEVRYTNIFSFRYSPRPLTAASRMKDDIPFEVKKRRLIEVQELQKRIQLEDNKNHVGKVMKVLCLGKSKKNAHIYSGRNESYQVVNFKSSKDLRGEFTDVLITACGPHSLQGKVVKRYNKSF
ncbi:MAG: tRNA (N6-isopentenyl adenosine(37)-C2)-methylthiotransferase MiaB [Candidatus Aminicenantaceae bacterium]